MHLFIALGIYEMALRCMLSERMGILVLNYCVKKEDILKNSSEILLILQRHRIYLLLQVSKSYILTLY